MITLITPTGSRPEAFALCEKLISNQTIIGKEQIQWIVVDDSREVKTECTFGQEHFYQDDLPWNPAVNTHRYNMVEGIKHVSPKSDAIFIIEDDDYYSPEYLETMLAALNWAEIVGVSNSKYYHLKVPGYMHIGNYKHSSLANVAITRKLLPLLLEAVHSGEYYFDIDLYKKIAAKHIPSVLISDSNITVGTKGLPGRYGLGMGHKKDNYTEDPDLSILKSWIGEDIKLYEPFIKREGVALAPKTGAVRKGHFGLLSPRSFK